jgi:CheY-like chemotaxis protein
LKEFSKFSYAKDNNLRIPNAEHELTARTMLAGLLKKWRCEVLAANDRPAAGDVLDWTMPGMDVLDVIRQVRVHFAWQPPHSAKRAGGCQVAISGEGNQG